MKRSPLQAPQNLVRLCLRFYRPESFYSAKTANILRIMTSAKLVIKASSTDCKEDPETLIAEVAGRIHKDLQRVKSGASGYVFGSREEQLDAIRNFARYYVEALFVGRFNGDKAALSSERQIGLIEDTFEMLTRIELNKLGEQQKLLKADGVKPTSTTEVETPKTLWSIERPDESLCLICNSDGVEIVIKDFDSGKALSGTLDLDSDLEVKSVKYPLELPSEYSSDCVWLEVTTVTDWESFSATLHIGSQVSMPIPFELGASLQSLLQTPMPDLARD
jgi:hypothetical protein